MTALATAADVVSGLLMLAGGLLSVSAGVALLRFGDLLSRIHAATKPQVLGLLCILLAAVIQAPTAKVVAALALVAAFQLMTAPVGAQVVGRTAYRCGTADTERLVVDELADHVTSAGFEGGERSQGGEGSEAGGQSPHRRG